MTRRYPDLSRTAVADRRDSVRSLTHMGYSASEIGVRLGITRYSVIRHRKALGIAQQPAPALTPEQETRARLLIEDGASVAEIARTVGCSDWAIHHRWPDAAWTHRQRTDHVKTLAMLDPSRRWHARQWWGAT